MNVQKVVDELNHKFPGKFIIKNEQQGIVTEILCEVEPTDSHPSWSLAIAVVDKSAPHHHKQTTEIYHILKGKLTLHIDKKEIALEEGENYTIAPGKVHWAEGNETWIECRSQPGWTLEDHILN